VEGGRRGIGVGGGERVGLGKEEMGGSWGG